MIFAPAVSTPTLSDGSQCAGKRHPTPFSSLGCVWTSCSRKTRFQQWDSLTKNACSNYFLLFSIMVVPPLFLRSSNANAEVPVTEQTASITEPHPRGLHTIGNGKCLSSRNAKTARCESSGYSPNSHRRDGSPRHAYGCIYSKSLE